MEQRVRPAAHLPSPEFFARGEITTWMTDAGALDILHDMPSSDGARLGYDELNGAPRPTSTPAA